MKNNVLFVLFFLSGILGFSQEKKYFFIGFTDKGTETYQPLECLSARAWLRYQKNNISFTAEDYPVSLAYTDSVNDYNVTILYQTKWLNGLIVTMSDTLIDDIQAYSFVDTIKYIGRKAVSSKPNVKIFSKPQSAATDEIIARKNLLGIDAVQTAGYDGSGVLIAVIDDGFMGVNTLNHFAHLDIVETYDYVANQVDVYHTDDHGTRALGGIGGKLDTLSLGGAPNASFALYLSENFNEEQPVEMYYWVVAAERADSIGANLINTSLGYVDFDAPFGTYSYQDYDGETIPISIGANIASQKGIVVVISAGNWGNKPWKYVGSPADAKGVIAVGAVDLNKNKGNFSSIGPTADGRIKPDICGVGVATYTINRNGALQAGNGTSYAGPQVTGLLAQLIQYHPQYTAQQIKDLLLQSAHQYNHPDNLLGYGVPDITTVLTGIEASIISQEIYLDINLKFNHKVQHCQVYTLTGKNIFSASDVGELNLAKEGVYIVHYTYKDKFYTQKIVQHKVK